MALQVQRIDIVAKMMYKEKFNGLTCSLYSNDHEPRRFDTIKYYKICHSIKLKSSKWKIKRTKEGYHCSYEDLVFTGKKPMYGYVVHRKGKLLWAEKLPFVCERPTGFPNWELTLTAKIHIN